MTTRNITILAIAFLAFVALTQAVSIQHKLQGMSEAEGSRGSGWNARFYKSPRASPLNIDIDCRGTKGENLEYCERVCDIAEKLERKIDHVCSDFTVAHLVKKCDRLLTQDIADLYNTNSFYYNKLAVANQCWNIANEAWILQGVRNINCKQCAQAGGAFCANMGQFQGIVDKINKIGKILSKSKREIQDKCEWIVDELLCEIEEDLKKVFEHFNLFILGEIFDNIEDLSCLTEYTIKLYEEECEDNTREIKKLWKKIKDFNIVPEKCKVTTNFDFGKFAVRGVDKLDTCMNKFWPKK